MADQRLIDSLTALTGQMTLNQQTQAQAQQQLHNDLAAQAAAIQQQQQAHQALLVQLAIPPPARGPRAAAVGLVQSYSGLTSESLADWLSVLNRTSVSEGWSDDMKRQVAIGKLSGPALQWHDLSGNQQATWPLWLAALEATFRPRLSLVEWCLQIERRVQLPSESGAQYALEKVKLCRLCPHQLADGDIVNYLSKGLIMPDQRSIMLANPPGNIDAFITRIRDLESVSCGLSNINQPAANLTPPPAVAAFVAQPPATDLAPIPKGFGDQLNQSVREMRSMLQMQPGWRPSFNAVRTPTNLPAAQSSQQPSPMTSVRPNLNGAFVLRSRRPVNEITCFTPDK